MIARPEDEDAASGADGFGWILGVRRAAIDSTTPGGFSLGRAPVLPLKCPTARTPPRAPSGAPAAFDEVAARPEATHSSSYRPEEKDF
jgi:hypothetical protein